MRSGAAPGPGGHLRRAGADHHLGHGALRLSASAFHEEMMEVQKQIGDTVWQNNRKNANSGAVRAALKKAKEGGGC